MLNSPTAATMIADASSDQAIGKGGAEARQDDPYWLLARLLTLRSPTRPLVDPAEWEVLVRIAMAESVAPLLRWALARQTGVRPPAAVREQLDSLYRDAVYHSLRQEAVRARVCRQMAERSIPVLLLKGAALAFTCYDDPVTRPMSDLDLLVPSSRLAEASRTLEEDGFHLSSPQRSLLPMLNRPHLHHVYLHRTTSAMVELHWEIKALQKVGPGAMAEIWAHSLPAGHDTAARMIRWGHLIPLLSAHMTLQHQFATLLWLYDIHRVLLQSDAVDVQLAREASRRWGLAPCTANVLRHVRTLFGTPLPAELETWAGQVASRGGLQSRVSRLALTPDAAELPDNRLLNLLLNGDWRFLRSLLPAPEVVRQRFNLTGSQGVAAAYLVLLARRLRQSPAQMRRLWRCWRDAPRSGADRQRL